MSVSPSYQTFILEQLSAAGTVTARPMFGGVGLYCQGLFFALIDDDTLYLKVDDATRAEFERLGARPMIERVRHRLRSAGVRGLKRGPRSSTRDHPAGLTAAEVAVLAQLSAGLRSKQIAALLHRSPRTVDHHLQAIFVKLGVATRAEAVAAFIRLDVVSEPGSS